MCLLDREDLHLALITLEASLFFCHLKVEEERNEAVKKFGANLTGGNRLKRYLTVRKGKTLMKRGNLFESP